MKSFLRENSGALLFTFLIIVLVGLVIWGSIIKEQTTTKKMLECFTKAESEWCYRNIK